MTEASSPRSPTHNGRFVTLRGISPTDYQWLYELMTSPDVAYGWRLRGTTPPPAAFPSLLARSANLQYVVCRRADGEPIGMVEAYQANEMQGTLFVSIIIRPDLHNSGWPMEAHLVFFNILFEMWNIRKIYFEGFEFQVGPNARAPFATLEGRLTDHQYFAGRYRDWLIFSISREDWEATGSAAVLPQADG